MKVKSNIKAGLTVYVLATQAQAQAQEQTSASTQALEFALEI
jgi:hypothetical protein